MASERNNCFEDFWRSLASEPDVDPDIYVVRCDKAGIERTYYGKPTKRLLSSICVSECLYRDKEDT